MDWGSNNKLVQKWLSDFLNSGFKPSLESWMLLLGRRWPRIPWRSAHIEIRETPDGRSIRRVYGAGREPLAHSEMALSKLPITLVIPEQQVLQQVLHLPKVAAKDLATLLTHEVSRHTPFSAEQVSFTWRVKPAADDKSGQIVLLWVLPLAQWQQYCAREQAVLARITRVDVVDAHGQTLGINLLPKPEQVAYWTPRVQRAALIALSTIALAGIGMLQTLHNRKADVARWQAQVTTLEQEARPVKLLKANLSRKVRMQELLAGLHRQLPSRARILDELTRCLPKDAILDRLAITGSKIAMDGLARSPEALIPALDCAKSFNAPRLVGTLQVDGTGGMQRFSLQAELKTGIPP